jgi:hypothetical protein
MLAALMLALAIPTATAAQPQSAASAPRDGAPRDATEVKASGVIRGRILSLATGKPLRRPAWDRYHAARFRESFP